MSNVIQLDPPHALVCWRCKVAGPVQIYALASVDPETFAPEVMQGERSTQLCPKCIAVVEMVWSALVDSMTDGSGL